MWNEHLGRRQLGRHHRLMKQEPAPVLNGLVALLMNSITAFFRQSIRKLRMKPGSRTRVKLSSLQVRLQGFFFSDWLLEARAALNSRAWI